MRDNISSMLGDGGTRTSRYTTIRFRRLRSQTMAMLDLLAIITEDVPRNRGDVFRQKINSPSGIPFARQFQKRCEFLSNSNARERATGRSIARSAALPRSSFPKPTPFSAKSNPIGRYCSGERRPLRPHSRPILHDLGTVRRRLIANRHRVNFSRFVSSIQ